MLMCHQQRMHGTNAMASWYNLQTYWGQHQGQLSKATMEEILYERNKLMHTRQARNNCGELVFDLHPAKILPREDVESGEHEQMTPSDFPVTRAEYILFKPNKFKERIYQEVKCMKFLYYLELKWVQEREKRGVPIDDTGDINSDMMQVEECS
jgi:hypothetical protein